MPTYFARRFVRRPEHVGRTEKAIGAFCLLLLVGIVAVFLLQTATNTDYLFDIDPAVLDAPEESGRQLVAEQMLPPLGDTAWEATGTGAWGLYPLGLPHGRHRPLRPDAGAGHCPRRPDGKAGSRRAGLR